MSLLGRVWRNILSTDVLGLAAQTAYYFFFSLFPLLLFTAPVISLVGDKQQTVSVIMQGIARSVPPGVLSAGAILTLWAGSNVFSALSDALNHAFAVAETRPWWKRMLISSAFVIGAGVVGAIATIVFLDGENVVDAIAGFVGLGATARVIWTVLQFPITAAFVTLLAWAAYYVLPNLRLSSREALIGAVVATVSWIVVTLAFRVYVQHFGNYNKTYGTIGAVVVLLTWMYLTMLSILTAGVLAAELHSRRTGKVTAADHPVSFSPGARASRSDL